MSDSTLHIGTLASNNVTAAQALVKARERNGRELQNGEKSLLDSLTGKNMRKDLEKEGIDRLHKSSLRHFLRNYNILEMRARHKCWQESKMVKHSQMRKEPM